MENLAAVLEVESSHLGYVTIRVFHENTLMYVAKSVVSQFVRFWCKHFYSEQNYKYEVCKVEDSESKGNAMNCSGQKRIV